MNGKEFPTAIFMKFTAHSFLVKLSNDQKKLKKYFVISPEKQHQFWKEKSDAFELYTEEVFTQKMDYIHENPVQDHWKLVDDPIDYRFSSMRFYEEGVDEFGILTHYKALF
jgi:hypothetical protein